jgi:hypothetical protein
MGPEVIVPIVAMITIFGMPVAIVYVLKHFKLKERELALEERASDEEYKALESRLARVEKQLGTVQAEMRQLPAAPKAELYLPAPAPARPGETKD